MAQQTGQPAMGEVNTPFQLCCASQRADAEALAKRLVAIIPGLQTRIVRESCQDSLGSDVDFYGLYVWHAAMTPEEICRELGKKECERCRQHVRDVCPETLGSSGDQGN
ncbi:hypothetical protein DPF_1881 [Desulfoplanes formicivorans]|uniref:Uncharacterized protein n=2 Tax=Desulfoplanes formicivorans TaxID=1592317 RepID=A0A194AJC6_9BACT|nr:hypothetical protein DPF_1881 [Desulfoplanes formicivorans]